LSSPNHPRVKIKEERDLGVPSPATQTKPNK